MAGREGQTIGNFQLTKLLGSGLFTSVYLGVHIQQKTRVAIKVLDNFDWYRSRKEEFLKEAKSLTYLQHPHIVRIQDYGMEVNNIPFLVMDYISPGNLRQRHPEGLPLPFATVINYVKQISSALHYLHYQQRVHGGIKPESILIDENNNLLLGDPIDTLNWYDDDRLMTDIERLRSMYMAPEKLRGKSIPLSDEYSLGIIAYEWLCGFRPFQGNFVQVSLQHLSTLPQPLREKEPTIPPAVEDAVLKALAKKPEGRFESVQAFADALERAYLSSIRSRTPDRAGQQFGSYRLVRLLGHGGFADVYLGQHRRLNTYAAIKVLHTHLSDEDIDGFQKEAQTIANLKHPYIVRVLDFDVEDGIPFLVMDYAPNGTLRQRHPKRSSLPITTVVSYIKQIANALQYAHDQKLIHRDIKPENMLLGPNNEILLSDFGIAVVAHSSRSMKIEDQAGTVYYMSPEQIQGKPRKATDQYALAVVVYEWLSGERPFSGRYMEIVSQHLTIPPPSLREKNPAISPAVEQVIMIALAKDPHQRFASVQAFANALEQASKQ